MRQLLLIAALCALALSGCAGKTPPPGAQPAELTRYMVERGHRRGVAGPLLLFAAGGGA